MQKAMKLFNGTEAIALFEQGEIIDTVIANLSNGSSDDQKVTERIRAIEDGICYMLSVEWLRLIHTNQNGWDKFCLHPRNNEGKITLTPSELAYYTQIANNFFEYTELLDGDSRRILQKTILEKKSDNCSNFEIDFFKEQHE